MEDAGGHMPRLILAEMPRCHARIPRSNPSSQMETHVHRQQQTGIISGSMLCPGFAPILLRKKC